MIIYGIFRENSLNDFCKNHILSMNLIVIRRVSENSDNERFRSKFQYDVLEK